MKQHLIFFAHTTYTKFLDLLSPPSCAYCKKLLLERSIFCTTCDKKIQPLVSTKLSITKKHAANVFAVSAYKEPLRSLILAKGWSDVTASKQLGQLIWQRTYIQNVPFDCIVPIPLHWTRYAKRGFNQAEEMANVLAKHSGKPVEHALKRSKRTKFQSEFSFEDRAQNVKGVLELNVEREKLKGKHILLVDDLMTSGATLRAAAKELLKCKPAKITVAVVCRVV